MEKPTIEQINLFNKLRTEAGYTNQIRMDSLRTTGMSRSIDRMVYATRGEKEAN